MATSESAASSVHSLSPSAGPTSFNRYDSVDALRGLIMMIMAIDHVSAYIARQHGSEFWNGAISIYTHAFPFVLRLMTHLCAPGFFFLMGAGIYWFSTSRSGSDAGENSKIKRIVWRGFVLLLLAQFVELPLVMLQTMLKPAAEQLSQMPMPLPNDGGAPYYALIVLTALGLVMMICGLLLKLRPWMWLAVSIVCVVITNTLLPLAAGVAPLWLAVLVAPGLSGNVLALYPVVPWLAAGAAGMYFGYWWRKNPLTARRQIWMAGAAMVATGVALRALGGWGNIQAARDSSWIEFLNNVKYPPSLIFLLLTIGASLLLLAVLERLPQTVMSPKSPLMVFGQTPLFFYLVHFLLLNALAYAFFQEPASLEASLGMWVVVIVLMYPLCLWYRGFKMRKSRESFWRML